MGGPRSSTSAATGASRTFTAIFRTELRRTGLVSLPSPTPRAPRCASVRPTGAGVCGMVTGRAVSLMPGPIRMAVLYLRCDSERSRGRRFADRRNELARVPGQHEDPAWRWRLRRCLGRDFLPRIPRNGVAEAGDRAGPAGRERPDQAIPAPACNSGDDYYDGT